MINTCVSNVVKISFILNAKFSYEVRQTSNKPARDRAFNKPRAKIRVAKFFGQRILATQNN